MKIEDLIRSVPRKNCHSEIYTSLGPPLRDHVTRFPWQYDEIRSKIWSFGGVHDNKDTPVTHQLRVISKNMKLGHHKASPCES